MNSTQASDALMRSGMGVIPSPEKSIEEQDAYWRSLLGRVAALLIQDPDAAYYLARLSAEHLARTASSLSSAIATLEENLSTMEVEIPAYSAEELEEVRRRVEESSQVLAHETLLAKRMVYLRRAVRSTIRARPTGHRGSQTLRSGDGSLLGAREALAEAKRHGLELVSTIRALHRMMPDRLVRKMYGDALYWSADKMEQQISVRRDQAKDDLQFVEPQEVADELLSAAAVFRAMESLPDPTSPKITVTAEATGECSRPVIEATGRPPYILEAGGQVDLLVDGTSVTVDLPAATGPRLALLTAFPVTISDAAVELRVSDRLAAPGYVTFNMVLGAYADAPALALMLDGVLPANLGTVIENGLVYLRVMNGVDEVLGSSSWISCRSSGAYPSGNVVLGLLEGVVARGTDVTFSQIHAATRPSLGVQWSVTREQVYDDVEVVVIAEGGGGTGAALTGITVQEGDRVRLSSTVDGDAENVWARVVSASPIVLDIPLSAGIYEADVHRDAVRLYSKGTGCDASLEVLAEPGQFGLSGSVRGKAQHLLLSGVEDLDLEALWPVRSMDAVVGTGLSTRLSQTPTSLVVRVEDDLDNDFAGEVSIYSRAKESHRAYQKALYQVYRTLEQGLDLDGLWGDLEALLERSRRSPRDRESLTDMLGQLNLSEILSLGSIEANIIGAVSGLLEELEGRHMDHARKLLLRGDLPGFFSLKSAETATLSRTMTAVANVARSMPTVYTVEQVDARLLREDRTGFLSDWEELDQAELSRVPLAPEMDSEDTFG